MLKALERWFKRKATAGKAGQVAAILLHEQQIRLLLLDTQRQQVLKTETQHLTPAQTLEQAVVEICNEFTANTPLVLVLNAERYQSCLLDKPQLPETEYAQALPWLVKDLVSWPVDDLVVDYIDDPSSAQGRIIAIAAQKSYLQPICKALHYKHKTLLAIVPDDGLVVNLLEKQSQAMLVLTQQTGQDVIVRIVKDGQIYLNRKLRGFSRMAEYTMEELQQGLLDNLLLEVQRSMDYFESQLRQPPVKEIRLLLNSPELGGIMQYFQQHGFAKVSMLNLQRWLPDSNSDELHNYWILLAACVGLSAQLEQVDETAH